MDDLWNRLIELWREKGLTIQPGVDAAAIDRFESTHGVSLPDDLRNYFQSVNGSGEMDDELFRFWPISEFQPVTIVSSAECPDCFVFADYCIDCWHYAVEIFRDGGAGAVFKVTGGDPPREKIAASFREFIELYLADAAQLV